MNDLANFNRKRAEDKLEQQMKLRLETLHIVPCAASVMDDEEWAMEYQTLKYRTIWRFITSPEEGSVEEAVMLFQGVIYQQDPPPFSARSAINKPNTGRYLRQSITLCGLQMGLFEKAVKRVLGMHALLARAVPEDEMEACSMVSVTEDGENLLHMGNHYLTPKRDTSGYTVLPIPASVDPQGLLARAAGSSFVYTDDNHVGYFQRRKVPGSDNMRYVLAVREDKTGKSYFLKGDLVEAQVTFIVLNLCEGKKKTAMVLQSLSLLDGSITQKSMVAKMLQQDEVAKVEQPATVKHCVGYVDEESILQNQNHSKAARPMIRRRFGYVHEAVSGAARRLSEMDIEREPGDDVNLD